MPTSPFPWPKTAEAVSPQGVHQICRQSPWRHCKQRGGRGTALGTMPLPPCLCSGSDLVCASYRRSLKLRADGSPNVQASEKLVASWFILTYEQSPLTVRSRFCATLGGPVEKTTKGQDRPMIAVRDISGSSRNALAQRGGLILLGDLLLLRCP